jgi:hypothetical protein
MKVKARDGECLVYLLGACLLIHTDCRFHVCDMMCRQLDIYFPIYRPPSCDTRLSRGLPVSSK